MRYENSGKAILASLLAASLLLTLSLSIAQVGAAPAPDIAVSYSASTYTITVQISNMSKGKNYYLKYYSPAGLRATHGPFYAPGTGTWNTTDTLTLQPTDRGGEWSVELYEEATHKRTRKVDVEDTVWTTDPTFTVAMTSFLQGETVYVKGIGYDPNHGAGAGKGKWYMRFYFGSTLKHTSPWIAASSTWDITYSYSLPPDAPTGAWTVKVYCASHNSLHGSTTFTVTAVSRGVQVSISPSYQSGSPGAILSYEVTIVNSGNVGDTYALSASDDAGWVPTLSQGSLTLPAGGSGTVSLTVPVPVDALGCTRDNVTVIAVGTGVENSATCVAHAAVARGVDVSISPSSQSAPPGATLSYEVTVTNLGNAPDTFSLSASDVLGWPLGLSQPSLSLPAFGSGSVSLTVTVPPGTPAGTSDTITVLATGTGASDFATCQATASTVRGVSVSISPGYDSASPGSTLAYTVTVTNLGNVDDAFDLSASDDAGWSLGISPTSLTLPAGASDVAILSVTVPADAHGCLHDNITVVATSLGDPSVSSSATCVAHAAVVRGVSVEISPSSRSGAPGETLNFAVRVRNEGNVDDTFSLAVSDNAGWSPMLSQGSLTLAAGSEAEVTLSVTIPGGAIDGEEDLIGLVATSEADPSVSGSANCIAQASVAPPPPSPPSPPTQQVSRGVSISISPSSAFGPAGGTLVFEVTVVNLGSEEDSFSLSSNGAAGWYSRLGRGYMVLSAGEAGRTALYVDVDAHATAGTSAIVEVTARSTSDPSASDAAQVVVTASALGSTRPPMISSAGGWAAPPMPASLVPLATSFVSSLAIALLSLYLLFPLARRRRRGQ